MTVRTGIERRQQAEEPWDWMLAIRQMLQARIEALSTACDDPRELTDLAAMLARVNKKIETRLPHSVDHRDGFRGMLLRPSTDVTAARLKGVPR